MSTWQILEGDCLASLRTLPDESVHCCVTSPPYWGLRDYGTARWEGGDPACGHIEMAVGMSDKNTLGPAGHLPQTNAANVGRARQYRDTCGNCGARRIDAQIGLEETPEAYVAKMVEVFREVRRVLRADGTCWLNLGDSYTGSANNGGEASKTMQGTQAATGKSLPSKRGDSLKPKDLVGIPWRVAFALQADGWYLRQDIIWHKPNPMPESVTDRCTKAHEYVFLLAKSERYFYDQEAVKEAASGLPGGKFGSGGHEVGRLRQDADRPRPIDDGTRNRRSVWTVTTKPYKGAHFATMPPALVEPCIEAGCPAGGTVLDPFAGSGTTLAVALSLGRSAIGCELNPEYIKLAEQRIAPIAAQPDLFAGVAS